MFQITLFEKPKRDGPLSKVVTLEAVGKLVSDGSYCLMVEGTASALGVKDMAALAWLIDSMVSPQHAIALGRLANGVIGPVPVTTVRRLRKGNRSPDTIARTKQYLVFIAGMGMMLLDFDTKGMSASVASKLKANGGFEATLFLILPELKGSERLVRASTSSGLFVDGIAVPDSGGKHMLVGVTDARDIPRATKVLHQRAMLAGYGWAYVGLAGQILLRSIVDSSVGSPERLVFEGGPVLKSPRIRQAPRPATATPGLLLDTAAAIPDLARSETILLDDIVNELKQAVAGEAAQVRKKADLELAGKLSKKTGKPFPEMLYRVRQRHRGLLAPDLELHFDDPDIGIVCVGDVLAHPDMYIGETLGDPLEPGYGRCKAQVMRGRDGATIIHSFAHGGAVYTLAMDETMAAAVLKAAGIAAAGIWLVLRHRVIADLGALDRLRRVAAKSAKITLKTINMMLEEDDARLLAIRRADREAERRKNDPRIVIDAPFADDPRQEFADRADAALSRRMDDEPPMRSRRIALLKPAEEPVMGLHTLGEDGDDDE